MATPAVCVPPAPYWDATDGGRIPTPAKPPFLETPLTVPPAMPTAADKIWLMAQLERLEQTGVRFGEWVQPPARSSHRTRPYWQPTQEVASLLQGLYAHRFVVLFDWTRWERLAFYSEDPTRVASASLEDCQRLLTAYVRGNSLREGHLAMLLETGAMQRLLRRICELLTTA